MTVTIQEAAMNIAETREHLRVRLERLNTTHKDTWPRWNNEDLCSVSLLLTEAYQLRIKLEAAQRVTRQGDEEVEVI